MAEIWACSPEPTAWNLSVQVLPYSNVLLKISSIPLEYNVFQIVSKSGKNVVSRHPFLTLSGNVLNEEKIRSNYFCDRPHRIIVKRQLCRTLYTSCDRSEPRIRRFRLFTFPEGEK